MQATPGAASSRLTIVLISVALVLALAGLVGIASGAANKPSKKVASTQSTTTTENLGSGLSTGTSTTLTTLPGVAGTTTTVKGATTATTAATTATTSPFTKDCPKPAASASDPGGNQPPLVGTYTYASCTDASDTTNVKVAAGKNSNGVTRRDVSEDAQGTPQTATEAWGPNGVLMEVLTINYGAVPITCDWQPDVLLFPAQLSVGKAWNADSKCTVQGPNGSTTIHFVANAKVSDRVNITIGATAVNTWVVDADITLETGQPGGAVTEHRTEYYDPARGLSILRRDVVKDQNGTDQVARFDHIVSLTPKAS